MTELFKMVARPRCRYLRFLLEKSYDIHSVELYQRKKTFTYGNSQKETTDRRLLLPTFFGEQRIDVWAYIIGGEAPLLFGQFGRPLLEELGLTMGCNVTVTRTSR